MDFRIAVPSYKRPDTVATKTLNYLTKCGIDLSYVDIFVADETEKEDYLYLTDQGPRIIVGVRGIRNQREFIRGYYDEGQKVLSMDDDIEYLCKLIGDKLEPFYNLKQFTTMAFKLCIKNKTKLWGVTAVNNPFYMKDKVSTNLKFIVGCFYGYINDKDNYLRVSPELKVKEDYELTIKHFKKFGSVIRFDGYSPKTKYYTEKGGLQGDRDSVMSEEAALFLLNKYPEYVSLNGLSSNGHMEIKIREKKND